MKKIRRALISVFYKDGLEPVLRKLQDLGVEIYSTGGTLEFILKLGISATSIEFLTGYPSILDGRVKTLHPKVFGGILARSEVESDLRQLHDYEIPKFDLVIVDLYPFEETLKNTRDEEQIIEKIDIGGIALIRAAAKNFSDVLIIPGRTMYTKLLELLEQKGGATDLEDRRFFATHAFNISSHYDMAIFNYFNHDRQLNVFKESLQTPHALRYGENPHQQGVFYGNLHSIFEQLHGKELSYNNLADLDAAIALIQEFVEPTFAILKHTNACGIASRDRLIDAWNCALACDPVSAYGGVLITNQEVNTETAYEINSLFFEIILAPYYSEEGLQILKSKKNRILLQQKSFDFQPVQYKFVLNGVLWQDKDSKTEDAENLSPVTTRKPDDREIEDLLWANKVVKHTKSNAIVIARNKQLLGSGTGQTSRVDATRQAIDKAHTFGFDMVGAVMASDAFFPFADSIELALKAGITAVIQPGGSVRDQESIEFCNAHNIAMVFTGTRHFKH